MTITEISKCGLPIKRITDFYTSMHNLLHIFGYNKFILNPVFNSLGIMWAIRYKRVVDNSDNVIYITFNDIIDTAKFPPDSYKYN
jgi:hypothetical protein